MSEHDFCAEIIWRIENFSYLWTVLWRKLESDDFVLDNLYQTSWRLILWKGPGYVKLCLQRTSKNPKKEKVTIKYQFALLDGEGSPGCEEKSGTDTFGVLHFSKNFVVDIRTNLVNGWKSLLNGDILTIRCRISNEIKQKNDKLTRLYMRSQIPVKKYFFDWNIREFSNLTSKSSIEVNFDKLFGSEESLCFVISYTPVDNGKCLKVCMSGKADVWKYDWKLEVKHAVTKEIFFSKTDKIICLLNEEQFPLIRTWEEIIKSCNKYLFADSLLLRCELGIYVNEIVHLDVKEFEITSEYPYRLWKTENETPITLNIVRPNLADTHNEGTLKKDIGDMYHEGLLSDFSVRVGSRVFPVHSNILAARSPVFRRMLHTDMPETRGKVLKLDDLEEDTVRQLLDYLYSDSPGELSVESALKLYQAGALYQVAGLKIYSADFLKQNLSVSNVFEVLLLADRHNDEDLKSLTIQFVFENEADIIHGEDFEIFCEENSKLGLEIFRVISKMRLKK